MSKGLEALDKLIDLATQEKGYIVFLHCCDKEYYDVIKKELKSLEIIIKKKVDLELVRMSNCLQMYNNTTSFTGSVCLIQEEYELLKEVLKDESI